MYASACIYMCCNTKMNIMKNQFGRPCRKKTTSGRMLVCVIFFPRLITHGMVTMGMISPHVRCTGHNVGGVIGGVAAPPVQGFKGGRVAPCAGFGTKPQEKKKIGPYFRWTDPPMVLCMGFHMVLEHDGFWPLVFCRSGQGNYGYVLIQG